MFEKKFNHYMVDVETTGTRPDLNHVVEIAAIAFDYDTMEQHPEPFIAQLSRQGQPHRVPDKKTLEWWKGQNPAVLQSVFSQFENPDLCLKTQLENMRDWVFRVGDPMQPKIFWAKPVSFDYMFLQGLFKDAQVDFPFPAFWMTNDMRSHCMGLMHAAGMSYQQMDNLYKDFTPKRVDAHSSLADVQWQLDWLKAVKGAANA
ncbi:MAG: hypothetical protein E6R03_12270 [Hyphomicrobiaceae bacterium]|nr:MAG: hypothetical protein E6R03_12270 [Hyphomicrobiaceae bacterium]